MVMIMTRELSDRIRNRLAVMDKTRAVSMDLRSPVASFTFDDFPRSAYEVGGRILESQGMRGTYFLSGELMDTNYLGHEQYSAGHLRAINAAGHELGCHSFEHKRLGEQGARFARTVCDRNAQFVKDIVGPHFRMTSFAYPYGDTSLTVKSALSKKFTLCRGVRRGLNSRKVDVGQVQIVSLESRHAESLDLKKVVREAVEQNSWIVFLTHEVCENPTAYGSTPQMIENAVQAVKEAGIRVLPMKQAAAVAIPEKTRKPDGIFAPVPVFTEEAWS